MSRPLSRGTDEVVGVTLEALNRRVFLECVRRMNALREHPEFYNTLTTNCTSAILMNARVNPDSLPFSRKVLLSGSYSETSLLLL